jgi:hypothetical protein
LGNVSIPMFFIKIIFTDFIIICRKVLWLFYW